MSAEGLSAHVGRRQKDSLCWCMKPLSKLTGVESQALLVDTRETNPYKYSLVRFVWGGGGEGVQCRRYCGRGDRTAFVINAKGLLAIWARRAICGAPSGTLLDAQDHPPKPCHST